METQQANPNISQLSSMNAFYGIPNLSQETTAAIERGAQAPEVYTPGSREAITPEPSQQTEASGPQQNPLEAYMAQATEQLDISIQAQAMQQEAQQQNGVNDNAPVPTDSPDNSQPPFNSDSLTQLREGVNRAENAPEQRVDSTTPPQASTTTTEPPAMTPLNSEAAAAPENNQPAADNPPPANYGQFSGSGPEASRASQPGNLFSAMG